MSIQQVKNLINGEIIAKNISKIAWYMSIQHCHHYFWNYWNETQRIQAYKIKECRAWENYSKCDANCSPVVFYLRYMIKYGSSLCKSVYYFGQKKSTNKGAHNENFCLLIQIILLLYTNTYFAYLDLKLHNFKKKHTTLQLNIRYLKIYT